MRHSHTDRSDHGEPVLPGERRPAEQVQGAGPGAAVCGGDGLDPGPGRGHTPYQGPGTRTIKS